MQLKKQLQRARLQLLYKRAKTLPCLPCSSTLPTRFPVKSIKSLNIYCLSAIFEYLDYRDLVNCRQVCAFWKECVDFHLAQRTHFSYGKQYNSKRKGCVGRKTTVLTSVLLDMNSLEACDKCLSITQKMEEQGNQKRAGSHWSSSSTPSNTTIEDDSAFSVSSLDVSTPSVSPLGSHYSDFEYRCSECQLVFNELREQLEQQMNHGRQSAEPNDFYEGYIDDINTEVFESILAKMPRLTTLKFAQGYRYGRLRQSCLEVSGVDLISRTYYLCPRLTRIDLSNCVGLVEADFIKFVELYGRQVVTLNLAGCRIDEASLRVIVKGCDRLRYLNVANNFCRLKGGCLEWIADSIETVVADFNQNVRVLDGLLQGKGRHVIELELNVGFCFSPNMPYKLIGNYFQDLISLKITFKSFGPRKEGIFANLSQLRELECLYLIEEIDDFDSESSLDDCSVLAIMSSCGLKLRELYLHASSSLFGRQSALTDRSIACIHELCPLLEVFSIKRASITDLSLESIAKLPNAYTVELIDLELISEEGVKKIMSSFKEVENQQLEKIKLSCGVDVSVGQNGPKIEKMKRHSSICT